MADSRSPAQVPAGMMGEIRSEVSVEAAPLLRFIMRHAGAVVGVVLLLIAGIVAAGVYQWHNAKVLGEARMALGKVLVGPSGAARIEALQALIKTAPASMRIGLWLEVAAAARDAQDYAGAAAAFGQVGQADKGTLGLMSVMNQSDMLLRAGDAAGALGVLEPLVAGAPETMRLMVRESVAGAAEAAGNTAKAIEMYESMLSSGQSGDVAYYKARIAALEKSGAPR